MYRDMQEEGVWMKTESWVSRTKTRGVRGTRLERGAKGSSPDKFSSVYH